MEKSQLIAKAQDHIQGGKPKEALACLKDYFEKNPHDYEILKLIGKAFLELKQLEKAKFVYNEAIKILEQSGKTKEKEALINEIKMIIHPDPKNKEVVIPEVSSTKASKKEEKSYVSKIINNADIFTDYGIPDQAISHLKDIVDV